MNLKDIGEFGFIRRITPDCIYNTKNVIRAIGDDAAVFSIGNNECVVLTTDLLVERVHFIREAMTGYQLGYKSLAVNLSDIAAMGAVPQHAFISIGIPKETQIEYLDEIYLGMKDLAKQYNVNILGGDTTSSKADLIINVAVTGVATKDRILYRNTARENDIIFCTGFLGDSRAGLDFILKSKQPIKDYEKRLYQAHCEPRPHIEEGLFLASTGAVRSCIDVSDGLSSDLMHIAEESNVGFVLKEVALPVSSDLVEYCKEHEYNATEYVLAGGEDYVLLCTVDAALADTVEKEFYDTFKRPLYRIGSITNDKKYLMQTKNGNFMDIKPAGWDHFA
ncbi:MAG: thiamine-phosphate kinase [Spirochaetes bacterium]|nr:thiamine-phosphate kinase [Spirochaetota bacterium]